MKKQLLPDNVFELLFGVGAGVVIIGALLKIINGSLIFSANSWLIVGLSEIDNKEDFDSWLKTVKGKFILVSQN